MEEYCETVNDRYLVTLKKPVVGPDGKAFHSIHGEMKLVAGYKGEGGKKVMQIGNSVTHLRIKLKYVQAIFKCDKVTAVPSMLVLE